MVTIYNENKTQKICIYNECSMTGLVYTRRGGSQKDLIKGKTWQKMWLDIALRSEETNEFWNFVRQTLQRQRRSKSTTFAWVKRNFCNGSIIDFCTIISIDKYRWVIEGTKAVFGKLDLDSTFSMYNEYTKLFNAS